jgi:hypothetical protein
MVESLLIRALFPRWAVRESCNGTTFYRSVMVFYKPGTPPARVFAGIEAVDGRILWSSPAGDVWALDVKDRSRTALLYRHGAWVVSNSALAVGCLAWTSARG